MYRNKELKHKVLIGPFTAQAFREWFHWAPAMTREKKLSLERRVIFNLSHGIFGGVNAGIPDHWFEGCERRVKLPTAHDLADLIIRRGRGCHLYSLDISRAYRVFHIDPRDWPLTGVIINNQFYVDTAVQFGTRRRGQPTCLPSPSR